MSFPIVPDKPNSNFNLGLCLAVSSSLFIGSSFIIKKISLRRLSHKGRLRAGAGGYGYLQDWMWWLGFGTMGVGELANFAAYAFAPASLVTSLGALSILVSAILASRFLDEKLALIGKLGCILCIVGSCLIVVHAPREDRLNSLDDFVNKAQDGIFLYYVLGLTALIILTVVYLAPRYGSRYIVIYIALCSAIGSFTVVACKALGLAIRTFFSGTISSRDISITFILILIVISCIVVQMNYLNKSLDLFDTNLVTPVYYVMFTTLVIIISSILFKEWINMEGRDVVGGTFGCFLTVTAIYLISNYKESSHQPLIRSFSSRDNVYFSRDV